jgi:hypothetical protein
MSKEREKVKYGNCYQFDLPDECLNADETAQVIDALLFDLKRVPVGESFVLDISIGPDLPDSATWEEFVTTRKRFHRAAFVRDNEKISKEDIIDFLRQNFADMLSLPPPKLKRIK